MKVWISFKYNHCEEWGHKVHSSEELAKKRTDTECNCQYEEYTVDEDEDDQNTSAT